MSQRILFAILLLLAADCTSASADPAVSPSDVEFFEAKVRPVLVEHCYKCHSHKEDKDKGGLFVDSRAALLTGGDNGPSILPGDPAKSKLIEAINYQNVDLQMPPKKQLSDAQKADLTEWVRRGAPWPSDGKVTAAKPTSDFDLAKRKSDHWAWQPVKPVAIPSVKNANWPASPIDRFVLAKLEEKGLSPAPQAEKRTLIRRASFAITGLPPTPIEIDAFLADSSPDAFARVVDRLLASPRFGEHWGRHWLDLVRYSETRGHEFDYDIPTAWQYRDYVIRALNADVPYNDFVIEHIAGDLLPKPRTSADGSVNESILATGFWFMNEWVHSPVDIRQDETDRVDNQIDVFGKTFQAVTLGCARCHDHKFDAISDEDYYALAGFLHSSSYRDVAFENQDHNRQVAAKIVEANAAGTNKLLAELNAMAAPTLAKLDRYLIAAAAATRGEKPAKDRDAELDPDIVRAWRDELGRARKEPSHPLHTLAQAAQLPESNREAWAALLADWKVKAALPAEPKATPVVDYGSLGKDHWITDGVAFGDAPAAAMSARIGPSADQPIAEVSDGATASSAAAMPGLPGLLRTPTFTISQPTLSMLVRGNGTAFICIDSYRMSQGPLHHVSQQSLKTGNTWRVQSADLSAYIGHRAHVEFKAAADGVIAVRWVKQADTNLALPPTSALMAETLAKQPASFVDLANRYAATITQSWKRLVEQNAEKATPADALLADWLSQRLILVGYTPERRGKLEPAFAAAQTAVQQARAQLKTSRTAMAMLDGSGFEERLLIRGSHKTPGAVLPRRFMEAIDGPAPMKIARGSGRLELAQRVASADNPLTSRVMVNRIWHHLYGRGIVATTDNFGVLGDAPSHPELLDYLASEFVKDGWSTKRMIRQLMLSRSWQMSSHETDAETAKLDPQNILLHRANLIRVSGEAIRDQLLLISGKLDEKQFGPSVEVYLTAFMEGRGRPGQSGPLDGAGRRSIYTKIRRNFLPPMMLAFDMPQPFNTMGRRAVSNVPAQALILMNDPFVIEQAKHWANRVLADKSLTTAEERVGAMYQSVFARLPTDAEIAAAKAFIDQQGALMEIAADKREQDARLWADLAHVLVNVKEFIYVP